MSANVLYIVCFSPSPISICFVYLIFSKSNPCLESASHTFTNFDIALSFSIPSISFSNSTKSLNTPSIVNGSSSSLLPFVLGIGGKSIFHKSISVAKSIISCILDLSSSFKSSKLSNPSKYLLYLL